MAAALLLASKIAAGLEAPGYELQWDAPGGCPDAHGVHAELDRALADAPPREGDPVRAAATIVQRDDGGYVLTLQVGDADAAGQRELSSRRCEELAKATVLIVALAVDPTVLERAPLPEPELDPPPTEDPPRPEVAEPELPPPDEDAAPSTEPSPTPPTSRPPPVVEDETSPPRSRGPLHVDLAIAGSVGLSVLPQTVGVIEAIGALGGRAWRAELGAQYFTPASETSSVNASVGGRFQAWAIAPRGCWLPAVAPLELPLCVGVAAGAIHGRGTGQLRPARRPAAAWAAMDVGGGLGWRPPALRGRLGLFVRGAVLPALLRPRFGTEQSGEIYRVPALGGRIGASIEVRLR